MQLPLQTGLAIPPAAGTIPLATHERQHFEAAFHNEDQRYVIQHMDDDQAVVVTASERFAADLNSSVVVCTCAGFPMHSFEQQELRDPDKCNNPHGVPVTCKRMDGSP